MSALATQRRTAVARPLKVLIPLIQGALQQGNDAGREHYCRVGEMLIEAQDQVGYGNWIRWLSKNFDMTRRTANQYMRLAQNERDLRSGASQVAT